MYVINWLIKLITGRYVNFTYLIVMLRVFVLLILMHKTHSTSYIHVHVYIIY